MNKLPTAYFVSHNGLGDNITNSSAVNFLLQYYDTIHFLCKDIYVKNIEYLFENKPVIIVSFDNKNEFVEIEMILSEVTDDIFVSGFHKEYVTKRITHPDLLQYKQNDKGFDVHYKHMREFYYDIGLDLSIYYEYFDIKSTDISKKYYESIKNYKIIFIHTKGTDRETNYDYIYEKYKNNKEYLVICTNKNMYDKDHEFYEIADKYVNLYVTWYIDIIKQAELFYMINSCFSCILYPLIMTNQISKDKVTITNLVLN
jgi:hypothetical protein